MVPGRGQAAVLLYDKPGGVTSHDVVARVRRSRPGPKVGHAGTLDPFATGLLLILLGRATRLQRYLMPLPKVYRATARLGWRSSTGDRDGELSETGRIPSDLRLPTGEVTQRVPMTSAVRVGGERLYRKAQRGESVETPQRAVFVHRAELIGQDHEHAEFEIECSSGTYVRTLIETLEDAYCEQLRRVAVGPFRIEDAGRELPAREALSFLPEVILDAEQARAITDGRSLPAPATVSGSEPLRLTFDGRLVAVARREGEELKPEVVVA
jgi:tRNA pseudouridine55 synthase